MSKRQMEHQGRRDGEMSDQGSDMSDTTGPPRKATAAQMANRKIANTRKASSSARSSRANTPGAFTPTPIAPNSNMQQSMPSFQLPQGADGSAFSGAFNFASGAPTNNPFTAQHLAMPEPVTLGPHNGTAVQQDRNYKPTGSIFNLNGGTPTPFSPNIPAQPQQNGLTPSTVTTSSFPSFGQQNGVNGVQAFGQSQQQTQSTPATSFGGFGQNPPEQNAAKPDSPFQFGQVSKAPEQNAAKPNSLFQFGQGSSAPDKNAVKPNSLFQFGQSSSATQQNGGMPSFGATSQAEQTPQPSTSNLFPSFGQQNQQPQQNGGMPQFGATSQAEQTPQPSTSNVFSSFAQKNQQTQQRTDTPVFTSAELTSIPNTNNVFSELQNGVKGHGLFGSTPPPSESTIKPGESVFSSIQSSANPSVYHGMFTPNNDQTPKPNIFGGLSQTEPNGTATSQAEEQTPKPSSNLFFGGGFGQQGSQQQSSTPAVNLNQSLQDTTMHTPGNTPQKSAENGESVQQTAALVPTGTPSQTPASGGGDLFSRITHDTPTTATKPTFNPSTVFNTPGANTSSANTENQTPTIQGSNVFDRTTAADQPSPFKPSDKTAAPWLSHTPSAATALASQAQLTQAPTEPAAMKTTPTMDEPIPDSEKQTFKVLNEGLKAHLANESADADWTSIFEYYMKQAAQIRKKPEPKFTAPAPVAQPVAQSALALSVPLAAWTASAGGNTSSVTPQAPQPSLPAGSSLLEPKAPKSNIFAGSSQQTPKPSILKAPQTAPVNKKRPADEDLERGPSTEKRGRVEYPKLPENASETAKQFQAALDKPSGNTSMDVLKKQEDKFNEAAASGFKGSPAKPMTAGFTPSSGGFKLNPPASVASTGTSPLKLNNTVDKDTQSAGPSEFQSLTATSGFTPANVGFKPSTAGFTPSGFASANGVPKPSTAASGLTPANGGFKPSTAGFTPSAPSDAGSDGFLAAFGNKANEEEEKARKKRKMEDYDSDEETEEAWAERDQREQEAKRQKIVGETTSIGFTPVSDGLKPAASGFMPSATSAPAAGSGGFLAAFGQKASDEEQKDRMKRKIEDYDSDEETEEEWAARDEKEQEAKRQKIMEGAKSATGFVLAGATSSSGSGGEKSKDKEPETPMGQGKSLFDRITRDAPATEPSKPSLFAMKLPSGTPGTTSKSNFLTEPFSGKFGQASMSSNLFAHLNKPKEADESTDKDKTGLEKAQGTGDNTWKPNTPIKFGASSNESTTPAATPAFPLPDYSNSLFGTTQKQSTESTGHLHVPGPKPAPLNFNFGGQLSSVGTSRATTPGMTTDGEGASTAGEDEGPEAGAQEEEEQVEDQCGLRESEVEDEKLLFSVEKAKIMKMGPQGWVEKGRGMLYILQHKETGQTRIVVKIPPYGKACMNFSPVKKMQYEVVGKEGKMVQGMFVDHFADPNPTKLTRWLIQVGKAANAQRIMEELMSHRPE